jgi:DNA-binding XRE family transcriptional regulator
MRNQTLRGAADEAAVEPPAPGGQETKLEAGARHLLALARGSRLAHVRRQLGFTQRDIAAELGVSMARISQIEHGEVISIEVIGRYVEALGGRLDLVAEFGDRTVHLPVTATVPSAGQLAS